VRERIEVMASEYAEPQQVVNWYYGNPEQLQQIEMAVLEDRWSITSSSSAQVEPVPSSYQDVMAGKAIAEPEAETDGAETDDDDAESAGSALSSTQSS
jgi:trigger factor